MRAALRIITLARVEMRIHFFFFDRDEESPSGRSDEAEKRDLIHLLLMRMKHHRPLRSI